MVLPHLTISSAFFFNDTATTEIYTLSLHDALPILVVDPARLATLRLRPSLLAQRVGNAIVRRAVGRFDQRSEEHTSELQSLAYLVCRLLLEKKKLGRALFVRTSSCVALASSALLAG